MSAQHTPGPWHVAPSNNGNLCIFGELEHAQDGYCDNCICAITPLSSKTEIDQANANLIAAAPELLEALNRLINQFDSEIHNEYDGTVILEDRLSGANHARAAIAKAKGETK